MSLRLQEIIWEITPECDRNCAYCGSKEVTKFKRLPTLSLLKIAKEIAKYGVDEVTLSGGEPGTLAEQDWEGLADIIAVLVRSGAKVKAVTNGKLLRVAKDLSCFTAVGVSINTQEEMKSANDLPVDLSKHTMITNFGVHNVFFFDELLEYSRRFGCWQVQLTMGEFQLQTEGIRYLRAKLSGLRTSEQFGGHVVVLADNLQEQHECTAGMRSCGVTHSGQVIACLSERAYGKCQSQGSLFEKTLKEIWEDGFKSIRFSKDECRKCCRDCIAYPEERTCLPSIIVAPNDNEDKPPSTYISKHKNWVAPIVQMYGVTEPLVVMYAVTTMTSEPTDDPNQNRGGDVMLYGCFGVW